MCGDLGFWGYVINGVELPGVVRVMPNRLHKLRTTRSWDYLNLNLNLNSPGNLLYDGKMGEGVIIGILDTGFSFSFFSTWIAFLVLTLHVCLPRGY